MTIDLQAMAREAGIEPRGSDFDRETGRWHEDTDLHISGQDGVSLPFLRAFANAVLEAAARECDARHPGARQEMLLVPLVMKDEARHCADMIRAMKVNP